MIPILVTDDDVRSETKIKARHGRLRPAQESIGLNLRSSGWPQKLCTALNFKDNDPE